FWKTLVAVGVEEIEASFPAASQTDFAFVPTLLREGHIPVATTIQVLTHARPHLIAPPFVSLPCSKNPIAHLYNATCPSPPTLAFPLPPACATHTSTQGCTVSTPSHGASLNCRSNCAG
ncbi:hypothetical protein B1218_27860, partial [Pseudomonas ogarae]